MEGQWFLNFQFLLQKKVDLLVFVSHPAVHSGGVSIWEIHGNNFFLPKYDGKILGINIQIKSSSRAMLLF